MDGPPVLPSRNGANPAGRAMQRSVLALFVYPKDRLQMRQGAGSF